MQYPEPISKLIDSYMKLPGIGSKTATRLAFYTIDMQEDDVTEFAQSLISAKRDLSYCSICGNITESDPCMICADKSRDNSKVVVVEQPKDVMSLERMNEYHGLYHVLHGVLSPIEGKGPEDINIDSLVDRIHKDEIKEVILALDPTVEGETTSLYIEKLIGKDVLVTRLAYGIPMGGHLDYTDSLTLLKAFQGRK